MKSNVNKAPQPHKPAVSYSKPSAPKPAGRSHQVQHGETLNKILKGAYPGISNQDLKALTTKTAQLNGLKSANQLQPGQKLHIPPFTGPRGTGAPAKSRYTKASSNQFSKTSTSNKPAKSGTAPKSNSSQTLRPWQGVLGQSSNSSGSSSSKTTGAASHQQHATGSVSAHASVPHGAGATTGHSTSTSSPSHTSQSSSASGPSHTTTSHTAGSSSTTRTTGSNSASHATGGLGGLSSKYESGGGPGTVSSGKGDLGGVSYGTYQFASKTGSAQAFVSSLKTSNPAYHQALAGKQPGSPEFSAAWKQLATKDPQGFGKAQHDYIEKKFYQPAKAATERAIPGLDFDKRSGALKDVLWSTAVQHGPGAADDIFKKALGGRDPSRLSDADIIKSVYAERGRNDGAAHFSGSSASVRRGVVNRYQNEMRDALGMLQRSGA